jgi:hypothetical protein
MKEVKNYQDVLNKVLEENGLSHEYTGFGEYDGYAHTHQVIKVIRPYKTILGIKVPFTRKIEGVARVNSESIQAKSQDKEPYLKHEGLEFQVLDKKYTEIMRRVSQILEKELEEPVKLIA